MKILIGDDHELISNGIVANFVSHGREEYFQTAKNKTELMQHLQNEKFDMLILDVQFGKDDARKIIQEVLVHHPDIHRIAISSFEDEMTVKSVLASGFQGYISKQAPLKEIIDAVDAIMKDEQYVSKDLEKKLFASLFNNDSFSDQISLTNREKQVLEQIQAGLSTKQMAEKLFISEKTVETYRSNLLLKFKVTNVAGLVRESILKGFIF